MKTNYLHKLQFILLFFLLAGAGEGIISSCSDDVGITDDADSQEYKGELVQFSAGTTANTLSTRADNNYAITQGNTYYMPDSYRFVCRMYYKAATGSANYDVSGNTDITVWMKVKGDVGNSLYWRNSYPDDDVVTDKDDYGNDREATMLYWQNRKEHAFLAWTNLNKAKTIGSDPTKNSGSLKFEPADADYEKHTGEQQEQWINAGYHLYLSDGDTKEFSSWADLTKWLATGTNYNTYVKDACPSTLSASDFDGQQYYYAYGWSCKYCPTFATYTTVDDLHQMYGWTQYQMFYDKLSYTGNTSGNNIEIKKDEKEVPEYLYNKSTNKYLAEIDIVYYKLDDTGNVTSTIYTPNATDIDAKTGAVLDETKIESGTKILVYKSICCVDKSTDPISYYYINDDGTPNKTKEYTYTQEAGDKEVTVGEYTYIQRLTPVAQCKWEYYLTDEYGNVKYDETKPRYTFYYRELQEKKKTEIIKELPANVFDLTRKDGMTGIGDQPDIVQALTIQAPLGATQAANRVNLYFKHQFSQVQVNIKSSSDNSVNVKASEIINVELLGVTEKGYVFTELDEKGAVEPSTYESVDVSKYDDDYLKDNPYGTSFSMFDMKDESADNNGYAPGYIKSYNALTFGQLQAIRISWKEEGTGIIHKSTYHVADETLKNLKSGYKYIWNIELRRGTLAIIRTEIVDWIVPSNELEYSTSGTINN